MGDNSNDKICLSPKKYTLESTHLCVKYSICSDFSLSCRDYNVNNVPLLIIQKCEESIVLICQVFSLPVDEEYLIIKVTWRDYFNDWNNNKHLASVTILTLDWLIF
jgi:hypothetical protein